MEFWHKMKALAMSENTMLLAIIILCSICSFGLGRLSVQTENKEPVLYIPSGATTTPTTLSTERVGKVVATPAGNTQETTTLEGQVIASKNGKNYYFENCSGAGRISAKNKITFASAEEAEKAGFTLSAKCNN